MAAAAEAPSRSSRLYEAPFMYVVPQEPDGLFSAVEIDHLMHALDRVKTTAVAA